MNSKTIQKGYKYRIYPDKKQIDTITSTFGCVRFVYNHFLDAWNTSYSSSGKGLSYNKCSSLLTSMKKEKETEWLSAVDSTALQSSLRALSNAYDGFFRKKRKHPRFHSKKSEQSYTAKCNNHSIRIENDGDDTFVVLPKLGRVKIRYSRKAPDDIISATVRRDCAGRYFVSLLCRSEYFPSASTGKTAGIDLGLKEFVITSDNEKITNSHYKKNLTKKLRREQKRLSRKMESNISGYTKDREPIWKKPLDECRNIEKQRQKIAKIHNRIKDQRTDFLQQESTGLIRKYDIICVEDLNVAGMMKNHRLADSISDVSMSEFLRMLEYKAEWNSRRIVKIDRYYPSSQTCHCCGTVNPKVKDLKVRKWICPECGSEHDRDVNASINIKKEGLRMLGIA